MNSSVCTYYFPFFIFKINMTNTGFCSFISIILISQIIFICIKLFWSTIINIFLAPFPITKMYPIYIGCDKWRFIAYNFYTFFSSPKP